MTTTTGQLLYITPHANLIMISLLKSTSEFLYAPNLTADSDFEHDELNDHIAEESDNSSPNMKRNKKRKDARGQQMYPRTISKDSRHLLNSLFEKKEGEEITSNRTAAALAAIADSAQQGIAANFMFGSIMAGIQGQMALDTLLKAKQNPATANDPAILAVLQNGVSNAHVQATNLQALADKIMQKTNQSIGDTPPAAFPSSQPNF